MNHELTAALLIVVVHVIGAAALVWGMIDRDDPDRGSWRDWWPREDRGDDGGGSDGPDAPGPRAPGGLTVPVLPESRPPGVRVREGARVGDLRPRPARRPAHPAQPQHPDRVARGHRPVVKATGAALAAALVLASNASAAAPQPVVVGNHFTDARTGAVFVPRGVNWPSFEYACSQPDWARTPGRPTPPPPGRPPRRCCAGESTRSVASPSAPAA